LAVVAVVVVLPLLQAEAAEAAAVGATTAVLVVQEQVVKALREALLLAVTMAAVAEVLLRRVRVTTNHQTTKVVTVKRG
jgi:hypothetical protein